MMFSVRDVPQAFTGFSTFELLYGRRSPGLLDLAKEVWEDQPTPFLVMVKHVEEIRERIDGDLASGEGAHGPGATRSGASIHPGGPTTRVPPR